MGGTGSGRPSKPTALKLIQGERDDRVNHAEPKPEITRIIPPQMTPEAHGIWDEIAPDLEDKGVLTTWDVHQLGMYCDAIARYRECSLHIDMDGYTARGAAGGVIKSPYWQIMRDCQQIASQIGSKYGLTPADRARLTMGDDEGEDEKERLLS